MFIQRLFIALFLSLCANFASAMTPDSGWWWNPAEGGRGYSIEVQDNQIYFAAYTYDANRAATWYYSFGTMIGDAGYAGRLLKVNNGPCFGCAQGGAQSVDVGAVTINFTSSSTASMTILGTNTQIQRFDFVNGDNTSYPNACYGEWSGVFGNTATGMYFGERVKLTETYTGPTTGTKYLKGQRVGNAGATTLCSYDASTGNWSLLTDTSPSYYQFVSFKMAGFNRMEGTSWTYLKSEAPAGDGLSWVASRTASKSYVQGGVGPASAKARVLKAAASQPTVAVDTELRLAQDKAIAVQAGGRTPAAPAIVDAAAKLANDMASLHK